MKCLILILIINVLNANCGLLKELLTPVTEKVQNNELLNENERKSEEPTKKGVLTNVVESLDTGADNLVSLLSKGKPNGKDEKVTVKPAKGEPQLVPTTSTPEETEEGKPNTTVATTPSTSPTTTEESKDKHATKTEDIKEISKEDAGTVTPASGADTEPAEAHTFTPKGTDTEAKPAETVENKNK